MVSPHGNLPAFRSVATGYGPCRSCLQTFKQLEEERIYLSYDPFAGVSDLPLPGPVFIHSESCPEHLGHSFPVELFDIPMLLEGFGDNSRLMATKKVRPESVDEQVESMLNTVGVNFIHIRNGEAGCFIAKIIRSLD
jgi:hypothetical protein